MQKKKRQKKHDLSSLHPYEAAAKKLRVLRFALIFILIAFVLGGMFVLREDFTAENLRFLVRDIGFSSPSLGLNASNLTFEYDTSLRSDLYRGDLVLLRRSSLDVYSFSGTRSLSESVAFSEPALVTGDKYMLAYDIGGTHLGIYNSFSELYTEDFDYKIACADLADDGTFAVVTAEKGYHSALYVYNSDFGRIFRYATAERVIYDVAVCRTEPNLVAVTAVSATDGDYLTEVLVFDTTKKEPLRRVSFLSQMPLEINFETPEYVSLLTDSALHLIAPRGEETVTHPFSSDELATFHSQDGYEVLATNAGIIGTSLEIRVFPHENPNAPQSFTLQNRIIDVQIAHGAVYLLSHDSLSVFSLSDQSLKTHKLDHEYKEILPLSGGRIAFVGEGSVSLYMVG